MMEKKRWSARKKIYKRQLDSAMLRHLSTGNQATAESVEKYKKLFNECE